VIALFYTETINLTALAAAGLFLGILVIFNILGIRKPLPYFLLGLLLWGAMLESGVHATLAGVLTALTIPSRSKFRHKAFAGIMARLADRATYTSEGGSNVATDTAQRRGALQSLKKSVRMLETPLQHLEERWHIPVAFVIVPLFALANAGVPIDPGTVATVLNQPIAMGIMAGLIGGKLIGVVGFSMFAVKMGWGALPRNFTFRHLIGVGLLAGIGFTMSIFIAELGFAGREDLLVQAKTGILFASIIAGMTGFLWMALTSKKPAEEQSETVDLTAE